MNIASRLTRHAIFRSQRAATTNKLSYRYFSKSVVPPNTFNMIQRKTHGPIAYFREWEALIFSHADYRRGTAVIWVPGAFATGVMFYCIWNSAWRDPEVRLRPHKRGWHFEEKRLARAEKYRGGGFRWIPSNSSRVDFIRKKMCEGLPLEPGQNGFEEMPIPKLD